jgi:hypothetical protein
MFCGDGLPRDALHACQLPYRLDEQWRPRPVAYNSRQDEQVLRDIGEMGKGNPGNARP